MRVAVCDDSAEARASLVPMIAEFFAARGISAGISEYGSGEALLSAFAPDDFALVFLDIYMTGMTGVETARHIKAAAPDCAILFTTASREHGADAFDVDAFYYLVKPVGRDKLFPVLGKWADALCEPAVVELKCGRSTRPVPLADILYVDVMGRNSTVHTAGGRIETSMPLSAVEALLPKGQFCRPIRYCVAALGHVQAVRDDGVLLDNGETLAVSRRERDNLRAQLAAYRLRALRRGSGKRA